jgi:hypothetical protein
LQIRRDHGALLNRTLRRSVRWRQANSTILQYRT